MDNDEKKINVKNVNEVVSLSKIILKIFLILSIVVGTYVVLMLLKELHVFSFLLTMLSVLTPFFIGLVVAWFFNPLVNKLQRRGMKRILGVIIVYLIILAFIGLVISLIIPLIYDQISDISETIPSIIKNVENIASEAIDKFNKIDSIDTNLIKEKLFSTIGNFGEGLYSSLPNIVVDFIKAFVSGIGTFFLGLLIGFFLLLGFRDVTDTLIMFVPSKFHGTAKDLLGKINKTLRGYVNGALFDASIILVACAICFSIFAVCFYCQALFILIYCHDIGGK